MFCTWSTFTKLQIQPVISILLQLQDDEKILKVVDAYQKLGSFDPYDHPKLDNYDEVDVIIVELNENYDLWYEKYLSDKLSDIEYMEHANVAMDYYERIWQISKRIPWWFGKSRHWPSNATGCHHIEIISSKIDDLIEKPTSGSAYRLRITLWPVHNIGSNPNIQV